MAQETVHKKKSDGKKRTTANTYDEFKEFEGKRYTGMKVGRSHKWYYDKGEWKEKKISPDEWTFTYSVKKERAWRAPEGSGVPVGTEYHWYIAAHQNVKKIDANTYTTAMTGIKYKLAHKRAERENWNISERAQKRRLMRLLEELTAQLKDQVDADSQIKTATAA